MERLSAARRANDSARALDLLRYGRRSDETLVADVNGSVVNCT